MSDKLKTDLELIEKCKEHLMDIVNRVPGAMPVSTQCALCTNYIYFNCSKCPINEKTGKTNCHGTPFYDARREFESGCSVTTARKAMYNFLDDLGKELKCGELENVLVKTWKRVVEGPKQTS